MNCVSCGGHLPDGARFCLHCGVAQQASCASCGMVLPTGAKFCLGCGAAASNDVSAVPGSMPTVFGYCHASGTAIMQGMHHFRCADCDNLYLEQYRFEDKPVCINCARDQGMAQALEQERIERAAAETEQAREAAARQAELEQREAEARAAKEVEERAALEVAEARRQALAKLGISGDAWVSIQGGRFLMGSPESEEGRIEDERQHWVKVGPFELMKTPVTWQMYLVFCEATKRDLPAEPSWGRQPDHPVVNVSYWGAVDYCTWLGEQTGWKLRLPTEAEWEYACRAGTTTPFSTGDTISTDQANYDGNYSYGNGRKGIYNERTTAVDLYPANPWGLHDMHGNVSEWCASVYDGDYTGGELRDATQQRDNDQPRVLRGGSWNDKPDWVRCAARNWYSPDFRYYDGGFRLARDSDD